MIEYGTHFLSLSGRKYVKPELDQSNLMELLKYDNDQDIYLRLNLQNYTILDSNPFDCSTELSDPTSLWGFQ